MSNSHKQIRQKVAALLKSGATSNRITITDITMRGCTAVLTAPITEEEDITLQILKNIANGKRDSFLPAPVSLDSILKRKSRNGEFYEAKFSFRRVDSVEHGISWAINNATADDFLSSSLPINHEQKNNKHASTDAKSDSKLVAINSSLSILPVTCHMCGEQHIPFRVLSRRTMKPESNIFGVNQYKSALPGKEFCNYNLIRITICPICYFASSQFQDFIREASLIKTSEEPFHKEPIVDKWLSGSSKREKLVEAYQQGLFDENRNIKQALLSYDLAILSSNAILKMQMAKQERARDYRIGLQIVSYILTKAELLMSKQKTSEAENNLKIALKKLQEIFIYLNNESSIKASYLIGMIGLYFEIPDLINQTFNFLQQYGKQSKPRAGTEEYKAWQKNLEKFKTAYQEREDFSRRRLKGFDKPFEF
ncbi:MAG: hypothetical protein OEY10_05890 [Nitrosopumilus sp.]|nr:hypothetical protein [Gammaproteobacteria bacterium]MDH5665809.1 hypothetical protein [Nitrosopumilus sp.]MDH5729513.1 hypothetical protein [Gammaproteobacteria bacterium]